MKSAMSFDITDIVKGVNAVQVTIQDQTDEALNGRGGTTVSDLVAFAAEGTARLEAAIETVVGTPPSALEQKPADVSDLVSQIADKQDQLQALLEDMTIGDGAFDVVDFVGLSTEHQEASQALMDEILAAEPVAEESRNGRPDKGRSDLDWSGMDMMAEVLSDLDLGLGG